MKKSFIGLLILAFALVACQNSSDQKNKNSEAEKQENRIITLNGALSETVYALGKGHELVGRDVTGNHPDYVRDSVKDLGHVRSISVESILSLKPTLILGLEGDLNEDLVSLLKDTPVDFYLFDQDFSVKGAKRLIDEVGEKIGVAQTEKLHQKIDKDLSEVHKFSAKPKVLFVYARGAGTLVIAGENTPMQAVIELAGAKNAVKGIDRFKPLTEEALLNANPDVVLLFDSGLESLGGNEGFLKAVPALSQTHAGKNLAFITIDGGLVSEFGPRLGEAAKTLNQLLVPYAE